ncbi:ankyrin repeat and SAM domain-containing protein 1A-like isoform X2 [Pectinophora gossypiella]|uniref:ankyrin repeat and SAM domain-containing protein 1A-like isoform X2 n=1 Tax=Pectinophora gossypiella TaxID=13191 RepID=UPI00214E046C|nr:ankyrin repeat and SAM domain-containing protein 1A-like isoform X2 [Pectinophora gossypiella]
MGEFGKKMCCGDEFSYMSDIVKFSFKRNWIITKKLGAKIFDTDSLRRGAGVNVQDDNGYTPLHHACLRGHKEIVQLLLSVDASPCIVDKKGATPLHLAAWKGDADIVNMLLQHNNPPNIDQMTSDQETALLIAARSGFVVVVEQLLANGADVTIKNIKDETALDLAAFYGRLETVQHLLRVRPQLVDPYKYPKCRGHVFSATPLHRASKNGHKDVVTALIKAGVDPNIRTYNGTPLHEAACFGKASVVRILLAKGADLNAVDRRGKTVHDLLADYSEEATRRVKKVIKEYESLARNTYESEEDLPPFPVQDYSPTGYPNPAGIGSGRRRWEEAEGTSEGDALSVSSAASSCAPLHLAHHHDYSKVSPTPPKKPPRRNLSVSPTHANSPSSGYSYELRAHARSQDDLDDIPGAKHYLKHGRSVDQYVDGKLSYSEYEENHNSPRLAPIPNPRPSLKNRTQPVAITAMYENVVIKEQNPRRKLRRNNLQYETFENRMENRVRKYSNQERSSLESLLDDQSMSPSDCERYEGQVPLSPTHYDQPPTPDHPPPSAKQAENSIHERIRPLSQEYKRRSALRDSYTETELCLLRAASAASVASGATDRSGNTDNCVEEYVCDVPFAGLFKGSTTTLDGIGLRPMPAERPKTLRKLKSVYDASPTETPPVNNSNLSSNGQATEKNINGVEDEVRRRSNTTSSTQSGDKSLSILSPFDEQEEWAKISEIMASFGSKLVRESVFVSELEQEFTSRLGLSCSESSLSPSVASNLGLWLAGIGLHDYEPLFLESGYDDIDFINGILDENDLREIGIEENDRQKILESAKQLPLKIAEISNNYNNNNISKNQYESVEDWLKNINLEQYNDTFRKHLYVDMDRVRRIWEVELTAVLEIQKPGHRKRILASVSGEQNGPATNMEDISADLNNLSNIQQLKEEIKEKLPPSENLKPVPPPVVPSLAPPGGETLKRSKKNRPAPQPPRPSDLEIRAPSELLVGVPGALKTQWKHQPFVLVTGAVTYVANYLGSTVVKELRGTESTKKSIQKLKKSTKEPRDSPDIILSISYRGVKFLNTITRELICEHEIRNIHCACQDADDLTHFAYITKDHATRSHYCHVFRVATMDQATEVILTLGEAFEVAYQMALREQSNRSRVTQSMAKTPTHDPMTTSNKEKPNMNHGRSHSITEIKLNGHQLKIAPMPASLSNEDFQASARNSDGSRSPRTPLLKAPIASTEEL